MRLLSSGHRPRLHVGRLLVTVGTRVPGVGGIARHGDGRPRVDKRRYLPIITFGKNVDVLSPRLLLAALSFQRRPDG